MEFTKYGHITIFFTIIAMDISIKIIQNELITRTIVKHQGHPTINLIMIRRITMKQKRKRKHQKTKTLMNKHKTKQKSD